MRKTFDQLLSSLPGTTRTIPLSMMKKAIEMASSITDTADLHLNDQPEQGRPTVGEDELAAYISRVNELWQEVCETDASEVRIHPIPATQSIKLSHVSSHQPLRVQSKVTERKKGRYTGAWLSEESLRKSLSSSCRIRDHPRRPDTDNLIPHVTRRTRACLDPIDMHRYAYGITPMGSPRPDTDNRIRVFVFVCVRE
jgi:hypothetical protein